MACTMKATIGLSGSALPARAGKAVRVSSKKTVALKSQFVKSVKIAPVRAVRANASKTVTSMSFDSDWLKKDPLVFVLGFLGWTIPSAIPIAAYPDGNSLFGLLMGRSGELLAQFPTGPMVDDKFWLYLFTYHIGLFTTMTLGQIGFQGKKQGY
eukprot:gene27417-33788_t